MATPQIVIATTASAQSTVITSTKVRVTANAAVQFAVGANPTATLASSEMIAANQTRYINMQGLGNKIAFVAASGTVGVSVTPIGTVYGSSIPGSTYIPS
jgi:phage tail sheath gpL-like